MRTTLSRYTEWAWSNGMLRETGDVPRAARGFHAWLEKKRAPRMRVLARFLPSWISPLLAMGRPDEAPSRGVAEIERDMWQSLRVLAYGGRGPAKIHERRKAMLEAEALEHGWSTAA